MVDGKRYIKNDTGYIESTDNSILASLFERAVHTPDNGLAKLGQHVDEEITSEYIPGWFFNADETPEDTAGSGVHDNQNSANVSMPNTEPQVDDDFAQGYIPDWFSDNLKLHQAIESDDDEDQNSDIRERAGLPNQSLRGGNNAGQDEQSASRSRSSCINLPTDILSPVYNEFLRSSPFRVPSQHSFALGDNSPSRHTLGLDTAEPALENPGSLGSLHSASGHSFAEPISPLRQTSLSPPPRAQDQDVARAIQCIQRCLHLQCKCSICPRPDGLPLDTIATALLSAFPHLVPSLPAFAQPLSLPKVLSRYPKVSSFFEWARILAGLKLLGTEENTCSPPTLNLWSSEDKFLASTGLHTLRRSHDIDSVIFQTSSLGVFRNAVSLSFMPLFTRGFNGNQHVTFGTLSLTEHKAILLCQDGPYTCHIFFKNMPATYTNLAGKLVTSQPQHLDDYCLGIWFNQVFYPALDEVCDVATRARYPLNFAQARSKAGIKAEHYKTTLSSRADICLPVRSNILGTLWSRILHYAAHIPNTCLPSNAFGQPCLIISGHNLKLSNLGGHATFSQMREYFLADYHNRWNPEFILDTEFWLDHGMEVSSNHPGTTLLRKSECNHAWAENFNDPSGARRSHSTHYTWAGTDAGSVTVELHPTNAHRLAGLVFNKAYNTIKEQFYTTVLRGHRPFSNEVFECLALSKRQLERMAVGEKSGGLPAGFNKDRLLDQWEYTKLRILRALYFSERDTPYTNRQEVEKASYTDRQEFRESLELFLAIPNDAFDEDVLDQLFEPEPHTHRPFWILPTAEVNRFRIAECNRWILCMEFLIKVAEQPSGTDSAAAVHEQDLNSLMSTTIARTLRLSLGCMNPMELPSLWLGKRWSRGRSFKNTNSGYRPQRTLQRRQGLEYKESVRAYGMIWIPERLVRWSLEVPIFRLSKYPHLDVRVNKLQNTSRKATITREKSDAGQFRDYLSLFVQNACASSTNFRDNTWTRVFVTLAMACVQQYNLYVWNLIRKRWYAHAEVSMNEGLFQKHARLSKSAIRGTEVLCYARLKCYLKQNLGLETIMDARAKLGAARSTFETWKDQTWAGRIAPLFTPEEHHPSWLKNSPFMKKVVESRELLRDRVPPIHQEACCTRFQTILLRTASAHIQAILHYTRDKASSMADSSAGNSATVREQRKGQSELERTKWMFPRIRTKDLALWRQGHRGQESDMRLTATDIRTRIDRWLVFTERDTDTLHYSRNLMRDASIAADWPAGTLASLEDFMFAFSQWQEVCEENSDSEDSDWPEPPKGQWNSDCEGDSDRASVQSDTDTDGFDW